MSFIGDLLKAGVSSDGMLFKFLKKLALDYESLAGSNAISLNVPLSILTTSSGSGAFTLADGVTGQVKVIILKTKATTSAVITPSNLDAGTTITFATSGQGCILVFTGTNWTVVGIYGGTVA